jgi:hypothetical protein
LHFWCGWHGGWTESLAMIAATPPPTLTAIANTVF